MAITQSSFIMKEDGTVWGCGNNNYGQLGDGTNTDRTTLVQMTGATDVTELMDGEPIAIVITKCIIMANNTYYTIDDGNLVEINDDINDTLISSVGLELTDLNANIDLLPNEFSLIFNNTVLQCVLIYDDKNYNMLLENNIILENVQNIEEITCDCSLDKSIIKCAVSIDNGATWKTYSNGSFIDLNVTIPLKDYDSLTATELLQWDNAKEMIFNNGIDVSDLSSIDFNLLNANTIRFAYVLHKGNAEDYYCNLHKTIVSTLMTTEPKYRVMKNSEVNIDVADTHIEITPLIDVEKLKVNMSCSM